jgi:hypothetical protein
MIGSLLNAHREVTISHELHALRYMKRRFSRAQIFSLILQRDAEFAAMGRVWSDSNYSVPGQYQGHYEGMRVIGDKRAGGTSQLLASNPELLTRVRRTVKLPIRVIHVTRNPFDIIASHVRRSKRTLPEALTWFEHCCRSVSTVTPSLAPEELIYFSYESFVADPRSHLARMCTFLGVEPEQNYLDACASIVWPSTEVSRSSVAWSREDRRFVEDLTERSEFLAHYSFEDGPASQS